MTTAKQMALEALKSLWIQKPCGSLNGDSMSQNCVNVVQKAIAALDAELAQVVEPVARETLLGAIARGWCSPKNSHKEMDSDLALAIGDEVAKLYTTPQQAAINAEREYLQPADLGDLMRFQETTDDSEGYDISKTAIKRLAELGVVQSHGFGKYGITAFGHFALEHMFSQNPSLPLMTNDDRDRAAITKATGAKP